MQLEIKKYLLDILEAAKDIEEYTNGLEYCCFIRNGMLPKLRKEVEQLLSA